MLETPRKRHRKARSGCRTCKLRRVKCDETFPACLKCSKLGQICDGYGVWGGGGILGSFTDRRAKIPSEAAAQNAQIVAHSIRRGPTSTPGPCISTEEQIYLDWFIHGTAVTPPRIFKTAFWDPAILQATASEPMVLQALLALSAAHKRHALDPVDRARDGLVPDPPEIFLLKHYGNAIKGLQIYLKEGKVSKDKWFITASMCAILILVSLMRGRFEEASVHLKTGARIAKQIVEEQDCASQSPILTQFFTRLHDQTALFYRKSEDPRFMALWLYNPSNFKLRFASPTEAGNYLDDLVEQVAHLAQQASQIPASATAALRRHRNICQYLLSCFESWSTACSATVAESGMSLTPDDVLAYEALQQRYAVSKAITERCIGSHSAMKAEGPNALAYSDL